MTFSSIETSRHSGIPCQLYLFVYGGSLTESPTTTQYFAYTDAEQSITYSGFDYSPLPIARESITSSGTLDKSSLTVRMSRNASLASLFQIYPPTQPITLQIRQGHVGDTEFPLVWSGRILSIGREGDESVLSAEPLSTAMNRPWLRRNYTLGCSFALYLDQCQANKVAATVTGTVSSISGLDLTLVAGWNGAFTAAKFTDGLVEWTNNEGSTETRRILSISGDTLSLAGYIRDLSVSDTVSVVLGCNHQMDDCRDLHNNLNNFGGCPRIPTTNPVSTRNEYF